MKDVGVQLSKNVLWDWRRYVPIGKRQKVAAANLLLLGPLHLPPKDYHSVYANQDNTDVPFAHAWAGLVNSAHASRYNFWRQVFRAHGRPPTVNS